MRIRIKILVLVFAIGFSSCKVKSYREKNAHYFDLNDQLNFIESNVINSNNNEFSIDIGFGHHSIKNLKSKLSVSKDIVEIKSIRETNSQITVDTIFNISKSQLLKEIEFQKVNAKNIVILAGHYQNIVISKNDKSIRYPITRAGRYLIEFLEEGKLHYAENTTANNGYK
ncbi:MAG: hypothetical protein HRT67_04435 [Flavobacteriaceae bacterium]|nr:hypothetical protein [Flavobacteriaceae bacterium]